MTATPAAAPVKPARYSAETNNTIASDALWYSLVTMSTVGYGDQYPVTNLGRVIGSFIILVGVGLFGTLTGFLANAFLAPRKPKEPAPEAAAEPAPDAAAEPAPDAAAGASERADA